MKKKKTRPPKTLKCSRSKTIRPRKLKSSHHVDLIRSIWWEFFSFLGLLKVLGGPFFFLHPLYFNYAPLFQKYIYALFLSQNLNLRTFLSSGKFCTQKSALRKVFNFSASVMGNTKNTICQEKNFMMVVVQFWEHFIIVMWQKYQSFIGLRIWFVWPEVPFLALPKIFF